MRRADFTIGEGLRMECGEVRIAGTAIEEAEEFAVATEVWECEMFGLAVEVETPGCTNITTGETDEEEHARVKLECEDAGLTGALLATGYADYEKSGPKPPPYEPLEEQVGIWFESTQQRIRTTPVHNGGSA